MNPLWCSGIGDRVLFLRACLHESVRSSARLDIVRYLLTLRITLCYRDVPFGLHLSALVLTFWSSRALSSTTCIRDFHQVRKGKRFLQHTWFCILVVFIYWNKSALLVLNFHEYHQRRFFQFSMWVNSGVVSKTIKRIVSISTTSVNRAKICLVIVQTNFFFSCSPSKWKKVIDFERTWYFLRPTTWYPRPTTLHPRLL